MLSTLWKLVFRFPPEIIFFVVNKMSDTEQSPVVDAPVKRGRGSRKGEMTEKQIDALKKGMAALKAKRELIAQRKADGTYDPSDPAVMAKPKVVSVPQKRGAKPLPREIIEVPRKVKAPLVNQNDLADIRGAIAELKAHIAPQVVEKVVEKEVEKIVEKPVERVVEKKLTGRELLDSIFFR